MSNKKWKIVSELLNYFFFLHFVFYPYLGFFLYSPHMFLWFEQGHFLVYICRNSLSCEPLMKCLFLLINSHVYISTYLSLFVNLVKKKVTLPQKLVFLPPQKSLSWLLFFLPHLAGYWEIRGSPCQPLTLLFCTY